MTTKMKAGQAGYANRPVIGITGKGPQTYLWIGNDAEGDMRCYATLSGPKTLRRFAAKLSRALRTK